jgi:hypothetical protein
VRSRYSKLNEYVSKGQIHLNKKEKVCLKRYSPNAQPMFFRKEESQYKQILATQTLRNRPPDPKRGKIACIRMIEKDIKEDTNLSNLECEMDIQNLPTSASVSITTIIGKKNKKTNLSK